MSGSDWAPGAADALAARLVDTEAELQKANNVLYAQEQKLMAFDSAEHHPRWTAGGELVLIGDHGGFGPAEGPISTGQVTAIDAVTTMVVTDDGGQWRYTECRELTGRDRLPRAEPEPS